MSISFENNVFTINTKNSTYQMMVDEYGKLLHLYYGRSAKGVMDYLLNREDRGFSGNLFDAGLDRKYSLDELMSEFPESGVGDFRSPAIKALSSVINADSVKSDSSETDPTNIGHLNFDTDLRYKSYRIYDGKYSLNGLPAVYDSEPGKDELSKFASDAKTLEIVLLDELKGIEVTLLYGVLPDIDIITRACKIKSLDKKVYITKIMPASLDFPSGDFDLIRFYGRHAMERNMERVPLCHGSQVISSRRGTSSHQYNPSMILADKKANEEAGSCYAFEFVYSGGFKAEVEKDQYNQVRVQLGLNDENFSYPIDKGEEFISPEVILTYSKDGLCKLSQNLHKCIRHQVCRGRYKTTTRPILVNSWEAAYFDFSADTIVNLAKEASLLGIDLVVMDDGWFGLRNDDNTSLGDWYVNEDKLGCSLKELADRVNSFGVKFGIWIEPEMVNIESELYRKHPDHALCFEGRNPVRSRNQLVLDFSRKEVVDHIFDQICNVIDSANIEYIKWDMNRSISDVFSHGTECAGRVLYDYMLGVYDFLERMNKRYPDILIEGCSGGGGRFDAGMLYYTPQIWCSDNTDAIDRLKIQYGTSFTYPISAVGSHVSAVPNHQTGRVTPIKTRADVAMNGSFGYELDLSKLSDDEKESVSKYNALYRKYQELIYEGDYFRLSDPTKEELAAWAYVSEDKVEAVIFAVMQEIHANMPYLFVKALGLDPDGIYVDEESGKEYSGGALMEAGIPIKNVMGSYMSFMWHLVKK